jgi:hypothetical protein
MAKMTLSNAAAFSGAEVELSTTSDLLNLDVLLYAATPTGFDPEIGYLFPVNSVDARIVADDLEQASLELAQAVASIGHLLFVSSVSEDVVIRELAGAGSGLQVLGHLLRSTTAGAGHLRCFANLLDHRAPNKPTNGLKNTSAPDLTA